MGLKHTIVFPFLGSLILYGLSHYLCTVSHAVLCTVCLVCDFTTQLTLFKSHASSPAQYEERRKEIQQKVHRNF